MERPRTEGLLDKKLYECIIAKRLLGKCRMVASGFTRKRWYLPDRNVLWSDGKGIGGVPNTKPQIILVVDVDANFILRNLSAPVLVATCRDHTTRRNVAKCKDSREDKQLRIR